MVSLVSIRKSAETIASGAAQSFNSASADLESYFGFPPRVLAPVGGARTKAQCNALGTPWYVSDHYEGAAGRAAVDIDNQREFRNINSAAFEYILGMHGWHNVTVSGVKFYREPWHFACHYLTVAGGIEITIPAETTPPPEEEDMKPINIWNTNTAPVAFRGATIGYTTIEVQRSPNVLDAAARAARVFGPAIKVTQAEFDGFVADVNERRRQMDLPPITWPTS